MVCYVSGAEFVVNGTGKNAAGESAVEQIQRITGGGERLLDYICVYFGFVMCVFVLVFNWFNCIEIM